VPSKRAIALSVLVIAATPPRLARASAAVVAPVPPFAIATVPVTFEAVPLTLPVTSPVTLPVKLPVKVVA